jgi:hypothetical protein
MPKYFRSPLTILFLFLALGVTLANQGSSDSFGYMWTDTNGSIHINYNWIDIKGSNSLFGSTFNDNVSAAIPLPFGFTFYGSTKNSIYVSSNGWIGFKNPNDLSYPDNTTIPSGAGPDSILAVYWDDLQSTEGNNGGVYYNTIGSQPNRKFVVQWYVLNGSPTPDIIEFEAILYEHSNLIEFQYNTIDAAYGGGQSATIGIKASTSRGNQYSFETLNAVSASSAILFHNSTVSSVSAAILPSTVPIGSFQTFTYTINNILPTTAVELGKLDRFAIGNPFSSNLPTITSININNFNAFLQYSTTKPTEPGYATWYYKTPGDSLIIQTSSFDIVNALEVQFIQTIPSVTAGTYYYRSSSDAVLDLSLPYNTTGGPTVTITTGSLNHIIIRDAAGGAGTEVTTRTLTTDQSLVIYAAGYDAGNNYIGDQAANWTLTGDLDGSGSSGTTSYTFNPSIARTSGTIVATLGSISGATGIITVNPGVLHHLIVRDATGGGGTEITTRTLTTDQSLTLYAAGYDADNNFRQDENANWTSTLGLSGSGTSITFNPTVPTSGTIRATVGSIYDETGLITVTVGALHHLIVRDAPAGGGSEVTTRTLTTDQSLTVYAAGYDADNNYRQDENASWTSTLGISGSGTSITFNPTVPTSGTIRATVGSISDETGLITVTAGALHHLIVRDAPGGSGNEMTTRTLTTDQSLTVYAAGYDAENNYRQDENASWTSTLGISGSGTSITFNPAVPTSGTIRATVGSIYDETGLITVTVGALHHLIIRDAPAGGGSEVTTHTMTTDQSLTVYAAGYDADNNYRQDESANWTLTGSLDGSGSSGTTSYTFNPSIAPTSGSIVAVVGIISDVTGTITVNPGALHHLIVRDAPAGGGSEVTTRTLTTDQSLTVYAAGYDADNNFRQDESASWTSTLGLSGSGISITFNPTVPTSGTIRATVSTIFDETGLITVTVGALHHLIIRNAAGGGGTEVNTYAMTTDDSLRLYSAGYDADNNFISDQTAIWTLTGNLDGSGSTGTSFTFRPHISGTSGLIVATVGSLSDYTGNITVSVGILHHIRINTAGDAVATEFTDQTLTTDQSVTLYAAGYDHYNNWRSLVNATWSSTGNLDPVNATGVSYLFDPVTAPTSGRIIAISGTLRDTTGTINVITGSIASIKIRTAAGGAGVELGASTITADDSIAMYAAGYDGANNYLADVSVNWNSTGTLDVINASGTSYLFRPVLAPSSGTIIATSGSLSDYTGTITVNVGTLHHVRINTSSGSTGQEFLTASLSAGQSVTLYCAGYDRDNNYRSAVSATWSSTGTLDTINSTGSSYTFHPVKAPSSGTIVATSGSLTDATGLITVSTGTLAYLTIRTAAGGGGRVLNDSTITADNTLTLYAAGYDANNNYLYDINASWTSSGTLDNVLATGTSYTFNPIHAPTSGTIIATSGSYSDNTGIISVTVGALHHVRINSSAGAGGQETGAVFITADQNITVYCAGYDADNNYHSQVSATWSSTGNLDAVSATGTSYTFNPVHAPTSGTLSATSGTMNDVTGTVTVSVGSLHHIVINSADGSGGTPFGNRVMTVDETVVLYAAGYDADNNYRAGVSASWSSTGTLDPVNSTGTSYAFHPVTAPSSGTIIALFSGLRDTTGVITVNSGTLASIIIRNAAGGGGIPIANINMTAVDTLVLFAAGYDVGGNFLADVNASWSSTGTLNPVSGTGTRYTFRPVTAPTSGTIVATSGGFSDNTGTISVAPGVAVRMTDPTGLSGNRTTVAGSTQLIRVKVEDLRGNGVSGRTVNFLPAGSMSEPSVVTDAGGIAQTVYTSPRGYNSSQVEAAVSGLTSFYFTVYTIRYVENSLYPKVVMRGNTVAFSAQLSNPGNVAVPISLANTKISFVSGSITYTATLQSPSTLPAANLAIPVQFNSNLVNASFPGGAYTPEIQIVGSGSYSTMNGSVVTNPGELTIGDSEITLGLVVVTPDQVIQGDTGINATMTVQNQGIPLPIDPYPQTRLVFRRHDNSVEQPVSNLTRTDTLTVLRYNVPSDFQFNFNIPSNYQTGQIDVYGVLSLDNGNLIKTSEYALGSFQANSAGNANYVAGSLQPNTAVPRETINLKASFSNTGTGDVVLNPSLSSIEILNSGIGTRTLTGQFTLTGNSTTTISFNAMTIPQNLATGAYNVRWILYGTLSNGQVYTRTGTISNGLSVLNPARLVFSTITILPDSVRLGQNDVLIDYKIKNQGQSTARISSLNHKFKKSNGEEILNNQWVPLSLLPALPDTLTAGQEKTYRATYTILPTAPTGIVYPIPTVSYQDLRTIAFTDIGQTILQNDSVNVIRPASMYINDLSIVQNSQAPNAPYVNQNREFSLKLVLHNSGEDFIESAIIRLYKQGNDSSIKRIEATNIGPGSSQDILFGISESAIGTITYIAFIDSASDLLGNPVLITQALDNTVTVYVQKPSKLQLNAVLPATGSDSLVVSQDQNFKVRVNIINEGQSGFQPNGSLVLRFPDSHFSFANINLQDSIQSFSSQPQQQYVEWDVRATGISSGQQWDKILFAMKEVPIDKNNGQYVDYTIESNSVKVKVEEKATVLQNIASIIAPAGAIDETVSSDQIFNVQANIIFNATVADTGRKARLILPSAYGAIEDDQIVLPASSDTCLAVWSVQAPDQPHNLSYFTVQTTAYDRNSGQSISRNSNQTAITTVLKAQLQVSLTIGKFSGAVNDTLSIGQRFILEGLVSNLGKASTGSSNGKMYIRELDSNPVFTRLDTLGSNSDTLVFYTGQPVRWYLKVNPVDNLLKTDPAGAKSGLPYLLKLLQKETGSAQQYNHRTTHPDPNGLKPAGQIFDQIVSLLQSGSNSAQNLKVKVSQIPIDENTSAPAFMESDTGQVTTFIQRQASISVAQTSLTDTVSTDQTFKYTVQGNLSSNLTNAQAYLRLPPSFSDSVYNKPLDKQNRAVWDITVPNTAQYSGAASETLKVYLTGSDINTGQDVLPSSPVSDIVIVQLRPKLCMKSEIISPGMAQSQGILSHGQIITINVWSSLVAKDQRLDYAGLEGSGSILLVDNLFTRDKFERVEGEEYEKNFNAINQKLTFKVRAPANDLTTSINFRFRQLPRDRNSGLTADVDVDSGTVSIPIRVRRKEIVVTLLDSLIKNTTFTRGIGLNAIIAFRISNETYKDPLHVDSLELNFKTHTDTSSLSTQTLVNMLDSVQVINYSQYKTILDKPGDSDDPRIFADYKLNESNTTNPLVVNFDTDLVLGAYSHEDVVVLVKFKPNSITRSFRTVLNNVIAYDEGSTSPVTIVDSLGRDIIQNPSYISEVYSIISPDPKESYGNYPNPFGQPPYESTKIVFFLNSTSDVSIHIFTLMGELVKSHWNRNLNGLVRGLYDGYIEWDGRNDYGNRVLNGVYLCITQITSNGFTQKYITKIAYIK